MQSETKRFKAAACVIGVMGMNTKSQFRDGFKETFMGLIPLSFGSASVNFTILGEQPYPERRPLVL